MITLIGLGVGLVLSVLTYNKATRQKVKEKAQEVINDLKNKE